MSNLSKNDITYVDAPVSDGKRLRPLVIFVLVILALIAIGALIDTQTNWLGGENTDTATSEEFPIAPSCSQDVCSESMDSGLSPNQSMPSDFNPPTECVSPLDMSDKCLPIFSEKVVIAPAPMISDVDRQKIDELNMALDAQLTPARKMNHLFIQYCSNQPSVYSSDYFPTEFGSNSYDSGYNYSEYDVYVEGLYGQFRTDIISADDTNEALMSLPASFSGATDDFC